MTALLLQLDGALPNIALMRLASHLREHGQEVAFRRAVSVDTVSTAGLFDNFDRVYASTIFEKSRPVAEALARARPDAVIGGTGWSLTDTLEQHGVTTLRQDYSIYPATRFSIGFSQRGCRLRCEFCVVPRKEGRARSEQAIADLWRGEPWPREIMLLDNDFFGQSEWRACIDELRAGPFKVCFAQGINARMLSEEAAEAIASLDCRDTRFKARRIYTAWDNRGDEATLFRGLDRLVRRGVKPDDIMVYMLIGYWPGETAEDREYRRRRLREYGARPYPMPFVRTPELVGFQRWVLGAYDKRISWADWSRARFRPEKLGVIDGAQTRLSLPIAGAAEGTHV
jgi:hypothetical protein